MKKYITIFSMAVKRSFIMRGRFLSSLIMTCLSMLCSFLLWNQVYQNQSSLEYRWENMCIYLLVGFFSNSFLTWGTESQLSEKIKSGNIIMDLVKPYNFYYQNFFESLGESLLEGILSCLTVTFLAGMIFNVPLPNGTHLYPLFFISFILGILVKYNIVYLTALCCFYTSNSFGLMLTRVTITSFFSGGLIPLFFLPEGIRKIATILPFSSIIDIPAQIFMGTLPADKTIEFIGFQFLWVMMLMVISTLFFRVAVREVTVHGG